jgi:hypothetical protein
MTNNDWPLSFELWKSRETFERSGIDSMCRANRTGKRIVATPPQKGLLKREKANYCQRAIGSTAKDDGGLPCRTRSHIISNADSKWRVKRTVSKSE